MFNNLAVDSLIIYTCDHVIKDFVLLLPAFHISPHCLHALSYFPAEKHQRFRVTSLVICFICQFYEVSWQRSIDEVLSFLVSPAL